MTAGTSPAGDGSEVMVITRREWDEVMARMETAVAVLRSTYEQDGVTVPLHLRARAAAVVPDVRLPESSQERSARKRREAEALGLRVL